VATRIVTDVELKSLRMTLKKYAATLAKQGGASTVGNNTS